MPTPQPAPPKAPEPAGQIDYHDAEIPEVPMTCGDCGRPTLYDYSDEAYHHAVDAARGCFLILPEDRPDDPQHPLL